jgi:Pyruvate phosphate dikinase, AMP/ATP-binding domain
VIEAALRTNFGHFAASQGLRFRSSSTVEDIEGFSGAGLYDSNTGFLEPAAQADPKERDKSIDWALRRTWASYWSWEAFEERSLERIDHLAGDMAVLVHARFDDERERSNAVLTLTLDLSDDRPGDLQATPGPRASLEVDVQVGALSVTNPPPERAGEILPEVNRVLLERADGPIEIERVARSTELASGHVLDDAALETLLRQTVAIAELWLEQENRQLPPAQARSRVTLDLEVREVSSGWPAYANGDVAPQRIVIKQVRSLDPGPPSGLERLFEQPVPRDLLLFADRIEKRTCRGRRMTLELLEVWTDPGASPPLGHAVVPFLARARLQAQGLEGGPRQFDLDHLVFEKIGRAGMQQGGPWALDLLLAPSVVSNGGVGLDRIESSAGLLRLSRDGRVLGEDPAPCTTEVLFASPDEFLRALLGPA